MFYHYGPVDPAQLYKVENTHKDYPPLIELTYNEDGHLIRDEEKRTLGYDSLGRLISVALPGETPGSYSYDPLDKVSGLNGQGGPEKRFYQGDKLASQIKGANSSTFMRGDDVVLAEHQAGADPKSLLMAGDDKNSVLSEVSKAGRKRMVYAPYGHRAGDASVNSHLGFNGERREGQTGWYMLGNGYRVFNTVLGRFHSPDSWSPFGEGGVNAYGYVEGNPIGNTDPTGHFSFTGILKFVGLLAKTGRTAAAKNMASMYVQNIVDDAVSSMRPQELFSSPALPTKTIPAEVARISSRVIKDNYEIDFWQSFDTAKKAMGKTNLFLLKVSTGHTKTTPLVVGKAIAWNNSVIETLKINKALLNQIVATKFERGASRLPELKKSLGTTFHRFEAPKWDASDVRLGK